MSLKKHYEEHGKARLGSVVTKFLKIKHGKDIGNYFEFEHCMEYVF